MRTSYAYPILHNQTALQIRPASCTDQRVSESVRNHGRKSRRYGTRNTGHCWETLIWPRWLPTRARLPLIAQLTGAALLVAAVAMPTVVRPSAAHRSPAVCGRGGATGVAPAPADPTRPAHLNLDVRHTSRTSTHGHDRRPPLVDTKLSGSGKRFGVFGKREERAFTKTLDLEPGRRAWFASGSDRPRTSSIKPASSGSSSAQPRSPRCASGRGEIRAGRVRRPSASRPAAAGGCGPPPDRRPPAVTAAAVAAASRCECRCELYQTLRSLLIAMAGLRRHRPRRASGSGIPDLTQTTARALTRNNKNK